MAGGVARAGFARHSPERGPDGMSDSEERHLVLMHDACEQSEAFSIEGNGDS